MLSFSPFSKNTANLVADALEFMYTPWPDNSNKYALRSQLVALLNDYIYFAPSHEVADVHSPFAPVYMYEFAYSRATGNPSWTSVMVNHGDNVAYDFGFPLLPKFSPLANAADTNVSLFIMTTYANFARSGEPTPQQVSGVTWEKFNSSHRAYLRVDANPKMAASFYPRRMAFWNDYHPKLLQVKFDTKKEVVSGASTGVTMGAFVHIAFTLVFAML